MSSSKKVIFSLILIVLCLGLIELSAFVALKILGQKPVEQSQNVFHPLRHHAYRPNIQLRDTHGGLYTDGHGYIKNGSNVKNPTLTILLTGASTLGTQTPFTGADKTISSRVEALLSKEFNQDIRVQSLSVTSYASFHEMMILYEYLEDMNLSADMVVSVNGLFTVYEFIDNLPGYIAKDNVYDLYDRPPVRRLVQYTDGEMHMIPRAVFRVLLSMNINTIRLIQYVLNEMGKAPQLGEVQDTHDWQNDPNAQALFARLMRREEMNYNMMHQIAQAHDMPFIAVLLPAAYTWQNWPAENMDAENTTKAVYQRRFYSAMTQTQRAYPVYDFSDVFDSLPVVRNPYTADDTVHYNDIGTAIVAEQLFEHLSPYVSTALRQKGAVK